MYHRQPNLIMPINTTDSLNKVLPGFGANSAKSSNLVKELLSGRLTSGERNAIADYGAERATLNGMPGSTGKAGTLFANDDLRNIGLASGARQQQGIQDFLALLAGVSGNVVSDVGQTQQENQFNQSQAQQDAQFNANLGLQKDQLSENRRRFDFQNFIGRPYTSDNTGQTYDAAGKNLGYNSAFDNGVFMRYRR
jgi:hypothetical protein